MAGALLSVVLASTLSLLAQARSQGSYAARRNSAIALARAKMDALVGLPTMVVTKQNLVAVDPTDHPGIQWQWEVSDQTTEYAAHSPLGLSDLELFEVSVTVAYPTATGPSTFTLKQLRVR